MKKLLITVNGKRYDVEVDVVQDTDLASSPLPYSFPPRPEPVSSPVPAAPSRPAAAKPVSTAGELLSPINGVVLEVRVKAGDIVSEKQPVVVLEAMKMKTNISAPRGGVIASVNIAVGDTVETGQLILTYGQ